MISWPPPFIPALPGSGLAVRVHDTASGSAQAVAAGPVVSLYVCGITPYDATHLGHAATYVTFDLLVRALRDAGHDVRYVQNITDVDDPLLERAARDGVDWRDLAASQVALFREDMTDLGVLPPTEFVGVVESIPAVAASVRELLDGGRAYRVPTAGAATGDVYLDLAEHPSFGSVSHWTREQMLAVFLERGGDPDREGKRDQLDPLLWRAAREGEPAWDGGSLGQGRPGWHIECTSIAREHLGLPFDVQGGGTDLIFPHHEMSAVQATGLTGQPGFARSYVHQAMVGYHGEKMSKSKGNLVLVSQLRQDGVDPMVIRLALLAHHYRNDWEWTGEDQTGAQARLERWREALSVNTAPDAAPVLDQLRRALADDLDTPRALRAVDEWAAETLTKGGPEASAPGLVARAIDALLGVRL